MPTTNNIDRVAMLSDPNASVITEVRLEGMDSAVRAHVDQMGKVEYNPDNPYVMLDNRFGVVTTKEEAAKYAETMEAARSFLAQIDKVNAYGNPASMDQMSREYGEMMDTHFARKADLMDLIQKFEQSDELMQSIVQRDLNRAIRNINAEEASAESLIYVPNSTVDSFVADVKRFTETEAHAPTETSMQYLKDAFDTYGLMDERARALVAPTLSEALETYIKSQPAEMAPMIKEEFADKPALVIPERQFDTTGLHTDFTNDVVKKHRGDLSKQDISSMNSSQLQEVVDKFKSITDVKARETLYDDYAAFIHQYIEEHPRSTIATAVEQDFRQSYIASCDQENKSLQSFFNKYQDMEIPLSERTMYLDRMEKMLSDFQSLDEPGRAAARGVVSDYVSQFNMVDIPPVSVRYEADRVSEPQRYSSEYYEIRDNIRTFTSIDVDPTIVKVATTDRAISDLSYSEMYQLSTMKEVRDYADIKEPDKNPFLELQQEVAAMQAIKAPLAKDAIVSDEQMLTLARQFASLTPEHRDEVFGDLISKMNRTEHVALISRELSDVPTTTAERADLTKSIEVMKKDNPELYDQIWGHSQTMFTDKLDTLRDRMYEVPGFVQAYSQAMANAYAGAETVGANEHIRNIRSMYLVPSAHYHQEVTEAIVINQERLSIDAGAASRARIDYEFAAYRASCFDTDVQKIGSAAVEDYLSYASKQSFKHIDTVDQVQNMLSQMATSQPLEQAILYPRVEDAYQKFIQANPEAAPELHKAYSDAVASCAEYKTLVVNNFKEAHQDAITKPAELMSYIQDFRALPDSARQELLPEYTRMYLEYARDNSNLDAQLTRMVRNLDDSHIEKVALSPIDSTASPEEKKQHLLDEIAASGLEMREMYMQRMGLASASDSFEKQYTKILDNMGEEQLKTYGETKGVDTTKDIKEQLQTAFAGYEPQERYDALYELANATGSKVSYRNPTENNANLEFERTLAAELAVASKSGLISQEFASDVYKATITAQTVDNEHEFVVKPHSAMEKQLASPIADTHERIVHPGEVQHEADCYKEAIKLRDSLTYSRGEAGLDVIISKYAGVEDTHVREIAAQAFVDKVEGYYNSSASRTDLYYTATEGDHDVKYRIESVIGPNAFYGIAEGTNERTLVLTHEPLDIKFTRDQLDLGTAMTGVPVVEFKDEDTRKRFESEAEFRIDNGKVMVDVYGSLTPDYQANIKAGSFTSYEVIGMDQFNLTDTVIRLQSDKGEVIDVVSTLTQAKIANAIDYDIRIKNGVYEVQETEILPEAAKASLDAYAEAAKASLDAYATSAEALRDASVSERVANAIDENVKKPGFLTKTIDADIVPSSDGAFVLNHNGAELPIQSIAKTPEADKLLVVVEEDGKEKKYLVTDTVQEIEDRVRASMPIEPMTIETKSGTEASFTTWGREEIAMCFRSGYDSETITVQNITEKDGKAVVTGLSTDGAQTLIEVTTDMAYNDAISKFGTAYAIKADRTAEMGTECVSVDLHKGMVGIDVTWKVSELEPERKGTLIAMSDDHLIVQENGGPIHRLNATVDLTKATDVVVTNEDTRSIVIGGHSEKGMDAFISSEGFEHTNKNLSVLYPERIDTFTEDLKHTLEGQKVASGNEHYHLGNIISMNATANEDNTYSVTVLTDNGNQLTAYRLEGLNNEQMIGIAKAAHIQEHSAEAAAELEKKVHDAEILTNGFNAIRSPEAMVVDMKNTMREGDISAARIIERDGELALRGLDSEGHAVTLKNFTIREERGEYIVYSEGEEGLQKNRIVGTAFGEFTPIKNAAEHYQELTWDRILGDKVYQNVDVQYTVSTNMDSKTPEIPDAFVTKVGLSFEFGGADIHAENYGIDDKTSLSTKYGVIINEGKNGPLFSYFVPEGESNLHMAMSLQDGNAVATTKTLPLSEIPADLASSNFVLVDYQNGVAIREGGLVYQLDTKEIHDTYGKDIPQNYYDPKIAEPLSELTKYATYVSEETFAGKDNSVPAINNWTIQPGVDGNYISFSELSKPDNLALTSSPIGQSFKLESIAYSDEGIIASISMYGKESETVKLGSPTAEQVATIERATETIITPTGPDKIRAYIDMINEKSLDKHQANTKALDDLQVGSYVIVKNEHDGERVGVLYQVVGKNHDLMIVGDTDNEYRHPTIIKHDELANLSLTAVELDKSVADRLRFAETIVHAEVDQRKVGSESKIAVTLGEKDLASDHVNGATSFCKTANVIDVDKVVDNEYDHD